MVNAGADQSIDLPQGATLDGTVTDDGKPTTNLTTTWTQTSGPGTTTFANPDAVDTTATFSSPGTYTLQLAANDTDLTGSDTVQITVAAPPPPGSGTLDQRITVGSDDAEESATGSYAGTSSDLELVNDGNNQLVGLRFPNLAIPKGSTITKAYVQFETDEAQSEATALTIRGQAADNPATFSSATKMSTRTTRTNAAATWNPAAWTTVGQAGTNQRTTDLSPVVQEIVNRTGWTPGNALALIITGTGHRTARAYEGSAPGAPLLHLEYSPERRARPQPGAGGQRRRRPDASTCPRAPPWTPPSPTTANPPPTSPPPGPRPADPAPPPSPTRRCRHHRHLQQPRHLLLQLPPTTPTSPAATPSRYRRRPTTPRIRHPRPTHHRGLRRRRGVRHRQRRRHQQRPRGRQRRQQPARRPPLPQPRRPQGLHHHQGLRPVRDRRGPVRGHRPDHPRPGRRQPRHLLLGHQDVHPPPAPTPPPPGTPPPGPPSAKPAPTNAPPTCPPWSRRSSTAPAGPGNALALIITGTGHRTARAYEGSAPGAPLLHLEYSRSGGPAPNQAPVVNAGADQSIDLPQGATLDGTVTDDGKPTTNLTTTWTQTSGPGTTTFANPDAVDTTATFSSPGTYTLQLAANDTDLTGSDTVQITVAAPPPPGSGTLDQRITVGSDDAEESATGSYAGTSSDLVLVNDGNNQLVGLRFPNLAVPKGSTITKAYVQFETDEAQSRPPP